MYLNGEWCISLLIYTFIFMAIITLTDKEEKLLLQNYSNPKSTFSSTSRHKKSRIIWFLLTFDRITYISTWIIHRYLTHNFILNLAEESNIIFSQYVLGTLFRAKKIWLMQEGYGVSYYWWMQCLRVRKCANLEQKKTVSWADNSLTLFNRQMLTSHYACASGWVTFINIQLSFDQHVTPE